MTGVAPLLLLVVTAPPAMAPTVAMVLVRDSTEQASGAAMVDAAVRQAVEATSSVRAVSAQDFERLQARARGAGIVCDLADAQCIARVGAFGGIDFALVPRVQWATHDGNGARATLTIALVDCATGGVVREPAAALEAPAASWGATALALTHAALGTAPTPPAPHDAPAARLADAPTASAAATSPTPPSRGVGPLALAGMSALGVGAVVAVGGGVGAWVVAPTDATRAVSTARQYNDAVLAGRALLIAGAAGLLVAGVGAALWWLDGGDPA